MAKTLKLKRPGSDAPKDGEAAAAAETPSPRLQPPPDLPPPSASYKIAGTLAIITTVVFLALIAVQILEAVFYQSPPSVWPRAKTLGLF